MGKITKSKKTNIVVGLKCDRCSEEAEHTNWLCVDHTFGYGTKLDMKTLSFVLCDECLAVVILKNVPNAKIKDELGNQITNLDNLY